LIGYVTLDNEEDVTIFSIDYFDFITAKNLLPSEKNVQNPRPRGVLLASSLLHAASNVSTDKKLYSKSNPHTGHREEFCVKMPISEADVAI